MLKKIVSCVIAGLVAQAVLLQTASARLFDNFSTSTNWTLFSDDGAASIVPAVQIDDNAQDTTTEDTRKDCYMAEWEIDWMYERLP
jgi:hypothetical protein